MKRTLALLVALSGCAAPTTSLIPPSAPNTTSAPAKFALEQDGKGANATYTVHSVIAAVRINGRSYTWRANGTCRATVRASGRVTGCLVRSPVTAYIQRGAAGLYTGYNGGGCWLAEAKFYGQVHKGTLYRLPFYYTGNC
jgi:hypothetical protein